MRIVPMLFAVLLLAACSSDDSHPSDEDIVCLPPQMVLVNPAESQHVVKKVYLHDEFENYKDERNVVATDIALGERTEPFELCFSHGCAIAFYITYTREKILGSVETVAVTTESAQEFTCGTRYTVYLLGEDFFIDKSPAQSLVGDGDPDSDDNGGPDDDTVL